MNTIAALLFAVFSQDASDNAWDEATELVPVAYAKLTDDALKELREQQERSILRNQEKIAVLETRLEMAQKGRISRSAQKELVENPRTGSFVFKTAAAKEKTIKSLQAQIKAAKERRGRTRELEAKVGSVGEHPYLFIVISVAEDGLIVETGFGSDGRKLLYLRGFNIDDLADGMNLKPPAGLLLAATKTASYTNAIGGKMTVVVIEPVKLEE